MASYILVKIVPGNGLMPERDQTITFTKADISPVRCCGVIRRTDSKENANISFIKMCLGHISDVNHIFQPEKNIVNKSLFH